MNGWCFIVGLFKQNKVFNFETSFSLSLKNLLQMAYKNTNYFAIKIRRMIADGLNMVYTFNLWPL